MIPGVKFAKRAISIVLGGVAALGVAAGAVSWYQLAPVERGRYAGAAGTGIGWIMAALLLPWATFFVSTWAGRASSNKAGVAVVAGYTILEAVGLWLTFGRPAIAGGVLLCGVVGVLAAAVYNLLVCDWIADKWA